MNYPGLEHLRADVAALSNAMCDVRMLLNRSNRSTGTTRQRLLNVWQRRPCGGSTPCFWKPGAKPGAGRDISGLTDPAGLKPGL